jgi:integrase
MTTTPSETAPAAEIPPKTTKPSAKPKAIHCGKGIHIYPIKNRANGKEYAQYTLSYHLGNQRVRQKFSDLDKAKEEADRVFVKLATGESEALKLNSTDRFIYVQAMQELEKLQHLTPPITVPLNQAVSDYVTCVKLLPAGVSIREAAAFYAKRNPKGLQVRSVAEVVNELVETTRRNGKSDIYLKDIQGRLTKFANAFPMPITNLTGKDIVKYLQSLSVSGNTGAARQAAPRTRNNHQRLIMLLINFAIESQYLPSDFGTVETRIVKKAKEPSDEIEIFSPDELVQILTGARTEMIPWLAIAAFAGLRHAEIQRLDWSQVNLVERHIEVKAKIAKTASRRLAPITDNLAAWLAPYAQPFGPVTAFDRMANQIDRLEEEINAALEAKVEKDGADPNDVRKFTWKHNGLRHSFISYRLAAINDAPRVALEAGNSPQMIFQHYRELVTPKQATAWFSIMPSEQPANLVPYAATTTQSGAVPTRSVPSEATANP